ncbi:LADA_0G04192g1_1 [Lachancea dasiensis]|uniref:LADA_0G04192g1_1 n=1 Tax=Lachancea dasiensis TaxID=1072105 RepID=A0A1G4JSG4_9SACH|nr:LADA_0G04192g1_1 [Lachancea dasiensis]
MSMSFRRKRCLSKISHYVDKKMCVGGAERVDCRCESLWRVAAIQAGACAHGECARAFFPLLKIKKIMLCREASTCSRWNGDSEGAYEGGQRYDDIWNSGQAPRRESMMCSMCASRDGKFCRGRKGTSSARIVESDMGIQRGGRWSGRWSGRGSGRWSGRGSGRWSGRCWWLCWWLW